MKTCLDRLIYLVRLRVAQGIRIACGVLMGLGFVDVTNDVLVFTVRKRCVMHKPMRVCNVKAGMSSFEPRVTTPQTISG